MAFVVAAVLFAVYLVVKIIKNRKARTNKSQISKIQYMFS